ncbi:MAG: glycosyltransferase [Rhodospirillales bacterium]
MRILHVIATLDPESGGPAQACLEMAKITADQGHDVAIFTTDYAVGGSDGCPANFEPFSNLDIRLFPVQPPRQWKKSTRLHNALRSEVATFDVVHIHSLYLFHNWAAVRACRKANVPYIIRPHGLLDPYIHRRHRLRKRLMEMAFQNRALRWAATIHYTADLERDISQPYACGAKSAVVPLGVDIPSPSVIPLRTALANKFPETANKTVLLFLGRLHQKKGLDLLIPALQQARAARPDLHLVLAGPDGGALADTMRSIAACNLADHVTIAGMLRGDDKAMAFAGADFFVLPSYSENFAIAAAEAMAYGLPVIVSDQINIHPDITAAGAGLVIDCSVTSLANAIRAMAKTDRQAMGERAQALAADKYSWPAVGKALEQLYTSVIADHQPT